MRAVNLFSSGAILTLTQEEPWPYNMPIFRRTFISRSPDEKLEAEIAQAREVSMSNPTIGVLKVSDGLAIKDCSPSFIWSNDSRYLAVPQLHRLLGLFFSVRVLIVDTRDRAVFASRRIRGWLQPRSFKSGALVVTASPSQAAREFRWQIPSDLGSFKRLAYDEIQDQSR